MVKANWSWKKTNYTRFEIRKKSFILHQCPNTMTVNNTIVTNTEDKNKILIKYGSQYKQ